MTDLEAERQKISALARQFQEAVQKVLQEVEVSRSAFEGSMTTSAAGPGGQPSRPSTRPGSEIEETSPLEELLRNNHPDLTDVSSAGPRRYKLGDFGAIEAADIAAAHQPARVFEAYAKQVFTRQAFHLTVAAL
jgi:hypothetical protein